MERPGSCWGFIPFIFFFLLMAKKTTLGGNTKKRTYNGVKYNQVVEVNEQNLSAYLSAGFEVYTGVAVDILPPGGGSEDAEGGAAAPATPATNTTPAANIGLTKPEELTISPEERAQRADFLKQMGVNVMDNWKDKTVVAKSDEMGYTADLYDPTKKVEDGTDVDADDAK